MQAIRAIFEDLVPLSDSDWHFFSSRLERQVLPKRTLLVKSGKTEKYLSFIEKGTVRYFIPDIKDDLTFGFGFQQQFVCAYDSFITQRPCSYEIESLSEVILWRIGYYALQEVYENTILGDRIGRITAEQLFLIKSRRELSLLTESAEQRYLNLFSERPELIREIPLKYVASYIGITPQALSRIRKRIS